MGEISCLNMSAAVIYYPVRHHSPACALHLERIMEKYSPDCVLIEGPSDADHLIPYLADEGTVPPVCIYSSYDDRNGDISEEKEKYRAYYPFLEYSPEYAAIKCAYERGIPAHFIDMPYGMMLTMFGEKHGRGGFSHDETAEYYRLTAEKSGCRSFSEFWERGFELQYGGDSEKFVKSVYMLGKYMRELSPSDERNECREYHMRKKIAEYGKKYNRIMVVAGAYHIQGLEWGNGKVKLGSYSKADSAHYIMPYSFAETDSRSGYGAGILFPSYYGQVWKRIRNGEAEPYRQTAEDFIVSTARYARTKQPVSLPDETEALFLADSLAALRGIGEPGAFELIDGVRSAFVKGDATTAAAFELDHLFRMMTGLGAGKVDLADDGTGSIIPPCVTDFRALCRKYRLNTGTVARQNTVLDVVKKKEHYEKSCFLHRLEYMDTGFCKCESGPDYANGRDTSLIRETWSYRYNSFVDAKLIDLSVFGGSIETICRTMLKKDFEKIQTADDAGKFLLDLYVTGFSGQTSFLPHIYDIIRDDMDFVSQCAFMARINRLMVLQRNTLGEADSTVCELMRISYENALGRLEDICTASGDSVSGICAGIRLMYSLSGEYRELLSREMLMKEIERAAEDTATSPMIYGVCLALCRRSGLMENEEYGNRICVFMLSSEPEDSADFISGVISAGRDIIFKSRIVLESIDSAVRRMDGEKFTQVLPQLRRAFTAFLPSETARISHDIAEIYGIGEGELMGSDVFSAAEIRAAAEADGKAYEIMKKWAFL